LLQQGFVFFIYRYEIIEITLPCTAFPLFYRVTQWARTQAAAETEDLIQQMAAEGATIVQVDPQPFADKALSGVETMEKDGEWSQGLWQQIRDLGT
jgi:TRAP-type C4-dicarboxylate transport system substrate-binding protein